MAEYARVLWAMYKKDLEDRGLFNEARAATLDRLVRAATEYHSYYPVAVAEGPVKQSKDGGQYVNMLWSQVQKLDEKIGRLEKSLTMTPESVGEKVGAVRSPMAPTAADKYLGRQAKH